MRELPPVYRLEPGLLDSIRYSNIAAMFSIMAFVALSCSRLVASAERALQTNDHHGHDMGDLVLQRVADAVTAAVRTTDSVARWGGEAFVVLLPNADLVSAMHTAERVRCANRCLRRSGPPCRPVPALGE